MALSGPGGTWASGPDWDAFTLPIEGVRVYYTDRTVVEGWGGPREGVAAVLVLHPGGRRTWVHGLDEYVSIDDRVSLLGEQIGEVNGPEWAEFSAWMRAHGAR